MILYGFQTISTPRGVPKACKLYTAWVNLWKRTIILRTTIILSTRGHQVTLSKEGILLFFLKNADLFSTWLIWVKSNKEAFSVFISHYIKKPFCIRWYIWLVLIFQSFSRTLAIKKELKLERLIETLSLSSSKNRLLSPRNHLNMFQQGARKPNTINRIHWSFAMAIYLFY